MKKIYSIFACLLFSLCMFVVISLKGAIDIFVKNGKSAQAELLDLTGRQIDSDQNSGRIKLGNNLLSGVYIIKINADKRQFEQRVIIQ